MIKLPIKYIILILLVCLAAVLIYPYFNSPATNTTVTPTTDVLVTTDMGNVSKEGPFGNPDSNVKIAYIVGVHPWEYACHEDAVRAVKKLDKSLKYQYYIYHVNVTGGADSEYETGRMNGQILAQQYVVPDIVKGNYQFAVDIHSNKGADDNYAVSWFLYVPYNDECTNKIADELQSKIPGIVFYEPTYASSPQYVTIPLIKNGTPAILYEAYEYDSPENNQYLAEKLLLAVDSLNFT